MLHVPQVREAQPVPEKHIISNLFTYFPITLMKRQ